MNDRNTRLGGRVYTLNNRLERADDGQPVKVYNQGRNVMYLTGIYDNGGTDNGGTLDRYTVVFDQPDGADGYYALAMSDSPYHSFGQHISCHPGEHLGEEVSFDSLTDDCKDFIRSEFGECELMMYEDGTLVENPSVAQDRILDYSEGYQYGMWTHYHGKMHERLCSDDRPRFFMMEKRFGNDMKFGIMYHNQRTWICDSISEAKQYALICSKGDYSEGKWMQDTDTRWVCSTNDTDDYRELIIEQPTEWQATEVA